MLKTGIEAQEEVLTGIKKSVEAVANTYGAGGGLAQIYGVVQDANGEREVSVATKDGKRTLEAIDLRSMGALPSLGARMVKDVSTKTVDIAGDGTTASAILFGALCEMGLKEIKAGKSRPELCEEMKDYAEKVVSKLKELSKPIETEQDLLHIATISCNNDPEMGAIVVEAFRKSGENGIVYVEHGKSEITHIDVVDGFSFDSGIVDINFANKGDMKTAEYEECAVLMLSEKVYAKDLNRLYIAYKSSSFANKPLVIISEEFEPTAISAVLANKLQFPCTLIKSPEFGTRKEELMIDIANMIGGTYLSKIQGKTFEKVLEDFEKILKPFGSKITEHQAKEVSKIAEKTLGVAKIKSDMLKTSIISLEKTDRAKEAVEGIKAQKATETDESRIKFLEKRIQNFLGAIATIKVGGKSESEVGERKDRFDDAVCAVKAAKKEGYVAGGATTLKYIADNLMVDSRGGLVLRSAAIIPFKILLQNADIINGNDISMEVSLVKTNISGQYEFEYGKGINAKTRKECDLFEEGIIDATMVVRCTVEHAVSQAISFLSSKTFITG